MAWPLLWQRVLFVVLAIVNLWEAYALFRQRPFLALLNGAIGLFLLVIVGISWPRKGWDQ